MSKKLTMPKIRKKRIPPEFLIRAAFEDAMLALRENRPTPKAFLELQSFLGRMLSDLLNRLYGAVSESDFDQWSERAQVTLDEHAALLLGFEEPPLTAKEIGQRLGKSEDTAKVLFLGGQAKLARVRSPIDEAITEVVAYNCKAANVLSNLLIKIKQIHEEEPSRLSFATDFTGRLKEAFEVAKELKSKSEDFDSVFKRVSSDPVLGLYKQLEFLVVEHRLHRRYMRSRFGMQERELLRAIFKRTRRAKAERSFWNWWNENGKARSNQSPEFESDLRTFQDQLQREEALLRYAQERLVSIQTRQLIWQNTIFQSFGSLWEKHGGSGFDLAEFSLDILTRMKPLLKDFHQIQLASTLNLKKEFALNYENELVSLSAWAANNLNLNLNKGAQQALDAEGRPRLEALLENIPANILLVLSEGTRGGFFSSGSGEKNVLSRVAEMLRDEQPLEGRHEAIRQNRLRKSRDVRSLETTIPRHHCGVDLLSAKSEVASMLGREEARIDLERLISLANLSPSESEVLELDRQELTDKEIAEHLGKPVGTVKPLLHKAKQKLRRAAVNSPTPS